ncbi:MAG: ammonium transporter [Candidatus Sumerlaeota bacterium]|nr:ammonium transporter [Candidatus Sumerlaeota bacterium]
MTTFMLGKRKGLLAPAALFLLAASTALADEAPTAPINAGDTAFVLCATALVLLMTPGLALFYGGMVRRKNVLGTIMHSFVAMAIISVQWVLWGYALAFGPDHGGLIGGLSWVGLRHVGGNPSAAYGGTIPHLLFMAFQSMFAVITPALISGAMAERIKFKTYIVFILLWTTLVYDPICHWVWNPGGWLFKRHALDFAGGTVVHMSSGFTALVVALMLGRRRGFPEEPILPHNLPFTILGAGLLWFGWFGFNAGSALKANDTAAFAFVATNSAAASAALTWMILDWVFYKRPTALGAASGAVAGLVAITPAAGFVTPLSALVIGILGGAVCRQAVQWRTRRRIDDSLDAFGVHGVGGLTGALATGLFASVGEKGLFLGNAKQLLEQGIAAGATLVYAVVVSFILLKVLDATMGLRVDAREEFEGLDLSQHGEAGYSE